MSKQEAIQAARQFFNSAWPEQLISEVMFYAGFRITRKEFETSQPELEGKS